MNPLVARVLGENHETTGAPEERQEIGIGQQIQQKAQQIQQGLLNFNVPEEDEVFSNIHSIYRLAGQLVGMHGQGGTNFRQKTASSMRQMS